MLLAWSDAMEDGPVTLEDYLQRDNQESPVRSPADPDRNHSGAVTGRTAEPLLRRN